MQRKFCVLIWTNIFWVLTMCSGLFYHSTCIINSCELQKPLWKKLQWNTTTSLTGTVYEGGSWGLALLYNLTSVVLTQMQTYVKISWAIYLGPMYLTWSRFNKPELEKVWPREWPRGFSGGSDGKESACNAGDPGLIPGLRRSPGDGILWRWLPTPVFLPGKFLEQRSL